MPTGFHGNDTQVIVSFAKGFGSDSEGSSKAVEKFRDLLQARGFERFKDHALPCIIGFMHESKSGGNIFS